MDRWGPKYVELTQVLNKTYSLRPHCVSCWTTCIYCLYDVIVVAKYKVTTLLICLNIDTMSCTQCSDQHCPHTFPICVLSDQPQRCIHPCSDDVQTPWQQCWYRLQIQIIHPADVLSLVQRSSNKSSEIWRVDRLCQHLPAPASHLILHITVAMMCCNVQEQNDNQAQAVQAVCEEHAACPYPVTVLSNIGHWPSYHLAQDGQAQVNFGRRTRRACLSEHTDCAVQSSSSVAFRRAIRHSVFSAEGQMNASMTRRPLKWDEGMHCLHFCDTADVWWQDECAWLLGHLWAHVESTLNRLYFPPKLLVRIK